jgi:hypothetical protein
MPSPIVLLCAWCGDTIRDGPQPANGASHGICGACLKRLLADLAGNEMLRAREAASRE